MKDKKRARSKETAGQHAVSAKANDTPGGNITPAEFNDASGRNTASAEQKGGAERGSIFGIPQKWGIFDTILIVLVLAVAVIFSAIWFANPSTDPEREELMITYTITARGLPNPTHSATIGIADPSAETSAEPDTGEPTDGEPPLNNKYWNVAPGTVVYTYSAAAGDRGEPIGTVIECRAVRSYGNEDEPDELMLIDLILTVVSYGYYDDIYFHAVNEEGFDILIIGNDKISVCGEGFILENAVIAGIKTEAKP